MRKRNVIINWGWEENYMPIFSKYFEIGNQTSLNKTILFLLKNKKGNIGKK